MLYLSRFMEFYSMPFLIGVQPKTQGVLHANFWNFCLSLPQVLCSENFICLGFPDSFLLNSASLLGFVWFSSTTALKLLPIIKPGQWWDLIHFPFLIFNSPVLSVVQCLKIVVVIFLSGFLGPFSRRVIAEPIFFYSSKQMSYFWFLKIDFIYDHLAECSYQYFY